MYGILNATRKSEFDVRLAKLSMVGRLSFARDAISKDGCLPQTPRRGRLKAFWT
jgi:hypothetical protein